MTSSISTALPAGAARNGSPPSASGLAGEGKVFAYIASPSFSGSTLLTFLLNAHPDVCTVGELKAGMPDGYNYVCSCGRTLSNCEFWRGIIAGHERLGRRLDLNDFGTRFERQPGKWVGKVLGMSIRGPAAETARDLAISLLPPLRHARARTLETIETFARVGTEMTGATIFLDGSKDPFRLKYLPQIKGFALKVIRIIRDGRGVMNSNMRNEGQSPESAARSFRDLSSQLDRLECRLSADHYMCVHYERLCREPDAELNRLYRFLGLDPRRASPDYRSVEHHIMGNRMRLENSREITLDEKWRKQLTPADLEVFERIAGDMNRKLGYE